MSMIDAMFIGMGMVLAYGVLALLVAIVARHRSVNRDKHYHV